MQIQKVQNNDYTSFNGKNTFLNKAKNAGEIIEKNYWKSLHYEAKARLCYQKYNKALDELSQIEDLAAISSMKVFCKMACNKLKSVCFISRSYEKFPNRFAEPDNHFVSENRYYKIKHDYFLFN